MRILVAFAKAYPGRSVIMLVCLLVAGLAEGVGVSSLLPLLGLVTRAAAGEAGDGDASAIERWLLAGLDRFGLEPEVGVLLSLIVGGMLFKAALVLVAQRQVGYTVAHVATDLRLALIRSLLAARWEYYVRQHVGGLANAFATEALRASQAYLQGTLILSLSIQALVYMGIALAVSWKVTIAALAIGSTTIYSLNSLVRMTRKAGSKQTDLLQTLLARMTDVLYSVKPLKAMSREGLVAPLLESETEQLNRALRKQVLSREAVRALQEPLLIATLCGGLYASLSIWALPMDGVLMLAIVFARLLGNMNKVQKRYQEMVASESAYWALRKTIEDSEAVREETAGAQTAKLERAITLDDVRFGYDERTVLDGVSLDIPAGCVTVIVGPSGSGKTSIVDLIAGLVRPQSGSIHIDDAPLADVDLRAWRQSIGYVPQETFLLHESVAVNVSLGDPSVSTEQIETALRDAGAWEFVAKLPGGIETPVGERGAALSGGQRQRIAIARALVHAPTLLVLDEATASLDPASEKAVCDVVRKLRERMTVLAVSHQTAILDVADKIYRLEDGHIEAVERPVAATGG